MMRIDPNFHTVLNWRAHALTTDFELEDVWRFPIRDEGEPEAGFARFREVFPEAMSRLVRSGPPGLLFRFREWLGRVFKWDKTETAAAPLRANSLRARFLKEEGEPIDGETREPGEFHEVYSLPHESLAEIANKTVHAAMHLGWVEMEDGRYTAQMAVYVKPLGALTKIYMTLITPFRLWIVYPALIRTVTRVWEEKVGKG